MVVPEGWKKWTSSDHHRDPFTENNTAESAVGQQHPGRFFFLTAQQLAPPPPDCEKSRAQGLVERGGQLDATGSAVLQTVPPVVARGGGGGPGGAEEGAVAAVGGAGDRFGLATNGRSIHLEEFGVVFFGRGGKAKLI